MPDIPVTVDPKLALTNADQKMALDKAFDDVFGPLDDNKKIDQPETKGEEKDDQRQQSAEKVPGSELPAAADELPTGETTDKDTEKAGEALPATGQTHPDDEPDEEVDRFKLHPDTKPETVATFRELRGQLKLSRKQQNELRQRIQKTEAELQSRVLPVSDPTVQKELDELRGFQKRNAFLDDSSYHTQYEQPVRSKFDEIINEVKRMSPDPEKAAEWERQMRSAGPDYVQRSYWNEGLISQLADPIDRDRMTKKVVELIEAQERRAAFRQRLQAEPDAYQKYQHETAAKYWQDFAQEAQDEANKHLPDMGDWANKRDAAMAKNSTEKAAIEAHNKAYDEFEQLFKAYITDASTAGPRGMTRVALKAVHGEQRKRELDVANKKLAKLQGELEAARNELNKIAGARARVAQPSSGAPANGNQPPPTKQKAGKSLDAAFKDFFGPP